jgi:hypothetical protein
MHKAEAIKNLLFIVYLKLLVSIFECKGNKKAEDSLCCMLQILWQDNHGVRKKRCISKETHRFYIFTYKFCPK